MGLFDKLFGEFIDVIEWVDHSNDTMVYRFERHGNEIKYGAKLTVRESQVAVFVNEGEVADVLSPGLYELETKNLPLLTTLQHWDHGFNSPFKAEVYFCSMRRFTDLKWGTKNPLMIRDQEFGAVRLRAFGTYALRIADALVFMREIVGTDGKFMVDEISQQLRNLITARFANVVGALGIPILDLAANYDQMSDLLTQQIAPEFQAYGLEVTKILIENISLPPSVEEALDKRTSMGLIGNLDHYLKYQTGAAMQSAAENPNSASEGIGLGVGIAMANKMGAAITPAHNAPTHAQQAPPPLPLQNFHIVVNGQAAGPFPLSVLQQKLAQGQLDAATLVWSAGMSEWKAAGQVESLAPLFSSMTPPPIPK